MADISFDDLIPQDGASVTADGRPAITVNPDYGRAISSIESGGNYRAVGPQTGKGRALGKYQVMDFNVGPWTQEILGRKLSPMEFLNSPEAQDAVFNAKFGGYAQKYGPEGAARAWFAGEGGMNDPNRRDVLGTSVADYGRKFNAAVGPQQMQQPQRVAQYQTVSFDDLIPQAQDSVNDRFGEFQTPQNGEKLQAALQSRALDMTRGPELSPSAQMSIEQANLVPAASQGTNPNISNYGGRLVSTEVFEDDAGNILYRDPQTKEVRPTNTETQVAIRDPADGVVKVFDRTPQTNESPVVGVSRVLAPGLASGAATARPGITTAAEKIIPKASDTFATAKPYYRAFTREAGSIEVPVETARGIGERLRRALDRINLDPDMAGQPAKSAISRLENPSEPMTLDYLQRIKRVASRGFNSAEKDVRDGASALAGEISRIIAEVSPSASRNLKTGDKIHSTAMAQQELQRKEAIAGLRTGRAGYGGNAVNNMRQVLSPIVQRAIEGRSTSFRPDEIKAMRDIVEGTAGVNMFRLAGQASPSKGAFNTGVGMLAGAQIAGPAGYAVPALGAASNKLATLLTGRQIEQLKEMVAKRSPAYAQAVKKAADRFERTQAEFVTDPKPARFAAYLTASRALSAGLTRDGIPVTSGDLLRSLTGPVKSAADDEQAPVQGPGAQQ